MVETGSEGSVDRGPECLDLHLIPLCNVLALFAARVGGGGGGGRGAGKQMTRSLWEWRVWNPNFVELSG